MNENTTRSGIRLEWVEYLTLARLRLGKLEAHESDRHSGEPIPRAIPFQMVKEVVQAQVAALDSTARGVGELILRRDVKRLPYYPKVRVAANFPTTLQSQLPGIARSHQDIGEAYQRHQPFGTGQELLGLLFDLAEVRRASNLPLVEDVDAATGQPAVVLESTAGDHAGRGVVELLQRIQLLVEAAVEDIAETAGLADAAEQAAG